MEDVKNTLMSLDELVQRANELLPRYLPDAARGELNARLVRHLATLGLIDEAGREGREARYQPRHLLQLLTVRRLMAEGLTTGALQSLLRGASDERLQSLLEGGARAAFDDHQEIEAMRMPDAAQEKQSGALDFLMKVRARDAPSPKSSARVFAKRAFASPKPAKVLRWKHLEIAPELEVQVREDFPVPATAHERDVLLEKIWAALQAAGGKS